jgi:hypothetical protein
LEENQKDTVGGVLRLSVPFGGGKKQVYATIESNFNHVAKESTREARDAARDEGWKEVQADINKRIIEVLNPVQADLENR